jgi:hypothetical protein
MLGFPLENIPGKGWAIGVSGVRRQVGDFNPQHSTGCLKPIPISAQRPDEIL